MSDSAHRARIRRLLLALDPSEKGLENLDEVVALAARLEAEIQGLFVEDTDFLGLAGHMVVQAYPSGTRARQALDPEAIQRTLRRQTERARRAVENAARRRRVRASFEVRRGRTAMALLESAGDDDLIVMSRTTRGFGVDLGGARARTGAAVREVVRSTTRSVIVLGEAVNLSGPLFVAFDGSPQSEAAIEFAATIAERRGGGELVILLPAGGDAAKMEAQAKAMLDAHTLKASYETLEKDGVEAICAAVSRRHGGVLAVAADQPWPGPDTVPDLLERIACSVVLVR